MKKLSGFLLCLFTLINTYGQSAESGQDKNYLNYYQAVARAEEAIVNGRYDSALTWYRHTFNQYPYNNPIDCYVAAQVAAYTGDTAHSEQFLRKGIQFGLPVYTILNNPHLATVLSRIDRSAIDSCLACYQKSIQPKARASVISLIKYDQLLVHTASIYEQGGYRKLKQEYRPIWDSLCRAIMQLTKEYGFPSQKIAGTQNGEDSCFVTSPHATFPLFILIHLGNAWKDFEAILWEELKKANITPQMYAVIYESSNGKEYRDFYANGSVFYFASRPCGDNHCKKFLKERMAKINQDRAKIGLCPYEVMDKKFTSTRNYHQWRRNKAEKPEAVFDFQCELNFQGKN
ncbi:MAG: hypothetical protein V4561_06635 [Bacteroidota bacterium]